MSGYGYEWLGYGLEIETPNGSIFLQGEEASELHDQLEACQTDEEIELILCDYGDAIESD